MVTFSIDPVADGPTNMDRDRDLLVFAEQGQVGARLYGWKSSWITLGRFQKPEETLVGDTPWVVRPTGGLAVLHGHDLTVAIAIPHDLRSDRGRSVRSVYRQLVKPLVEALRECGLDAELCEDTRLGGPKAPGADCFAFSSPNDVVDRSTGQKVCGCAVRITDRAALLQASIPFQTPLVPASRLIVGGVDTPVAEWRHDSFPVQFKEACLEFGLSAGVSLASSAVRQ